MSKSKLTPWLKTGSGKGYLPPGSRSVRSFRTNAGIDDIDETVFLNRQKNRDELWVHTFSETNSRQVLARLLGVAVGYECEPRDQIKEPAKRWLNTICRAGDERCDDQFERRTSW